MSRLAGARDAGNEKWNDREKPSPIWFPEVGNAQVHSLLSTSKSLFAWMCNQRQESGFSTMATRVTGISRDPNQGYNLLKSLLCVDGCEIRIALAGTRFINVCPTIYRVSAWAQAVRNGLRPPSGYIDCNHEVITRVTGHQGYIPLA